MTATLRDRPIPTFVLLLAGAAWLAAVGAGFRALAVHARTPAESGNAAPATWPGGTAVQRDGRSTLVMVLHPRCPCSRASLSELEELLATCPPGVDAHVLFVRPAGVPADWVDTDLWRRAGELPLRRHVDEGGEEARRFGAVASGHTVLYEPHGRLVFAGGITGARGHVGANASRLALAGRIAAPSSGCARTPTYGCPLEDPRDERPRL